MNYFFWVSKSSSHPSPDLIWNPGNFFADLDPMLPQGWIDEKYSQAEEGPLPISITTCSLPWRALRWALCCNLAKELRKEAEEETRSKEWKVKVIQRGLGSSQVPVGIQLLCSQHQQVELIMCINTLPTNAIKWSETFCLGQFGKPKTLLMSPWPVRMANRWRHTRWSWQPPVQKQAPPPTDLYEREVIWISQAEEGPLPLSITTCSLP